MALRRRSTSVTNLSTTAMSVDISHLNDSIQIGDGTNLLGTFPSAGGVRSLPVYIKGSDLSSSGGTAMTDDAAFTVATSQVTPMGAMADETSPDSVDEGDIGVVRMTLDRKLKVQVAGVETGTAVPITDNGGNISIDDGGNSITVDNGGTFAVQDSEKVVDNAGFTDGTTKVMPVGFIFDEVAGTALTENDAGAARIDSKRAQVFVLEDETTRGRRATVTASNAVKVDGSAVTQPVSGTFWQATQPVSGTFWQATQPVSIAATVTVADNQVITDNAGFTDGTSKLFMAGFIFDDVAGTALTENDAAAPRIDSKRSVMVTVEDATTRGRKMTISAGGAALVDGSAVTQPISIAADVIVVGKAAHDAAVSGNPVRVAGRAMLANGTAVAEDDTADFATDNQGRAIVTVHAPRDLITQQTTTITSSTSETTIVTAGGANVFLDLTHLSITNSSSTALIVTLKDSTAGTTRGIWALAANGGIVLNFGEVPFKQAAAANNNWTLTCGTSVASIYVVAQAVQRIA